MSHQTTGDNLTKAAQALLNVLQGEDELGVVVRSHIHVEYQLDQFILSVLPKPKELGQMNYSSRVRLALACGLRGELKRPLNALGKLRNKFAHNIGATLTDEDVSFFYENSGTTEPRILGWEQDLPFFTQLSPKDRLHFCVVGLWVTLKRDDFGLNRLGIPKSGRV